MVAKYYLLMYIKELARGNEKLLAQMGGGALIRTTSPHRVFCSAVE